jgi:hypothetical protein
MKSDLPILDADWVDIPAPETALPAIRTKVPRAKPTKQGRKAKTANPEGRVDVLCGGILTQYYGQMVGTAPPPEVSASIQKAATLILGKSRAKGPEWDFLKSLMGG